MSAQIVPLRISDRARSRLQQRRVDKWSEPRLPTLLQMVLALRHHQEANPDIWSGDEFWIRFYASGRLARSIVDNAEVLAKQGDDANPTRVVTYLSLCFNMLQRLGMQ